MPKEAQYADGSFSQNAKDPSVPDVNLDIDTLEMCLMPLGSSSWEMCSLEDAAMCNLGIQAGHFADPSFQPSGAL